MTLDVANVLGILSTQTITERLDENEHGFTVLLDARGIAQETSIISESGIYQGGSLGGATDVAEALGAVWNGTKTVEHVPNEWRGLHPMQTPFGVQNMITLSEHGLYCYPCRKRVNPNTHRRR